MVKKRWQSKRKEKMAIDRWTTNVGNTKSIDNDEYGR